MPDSLCWVLELCMMFVSLLCLELHVSVVCVYVLVLSRKCYYVIILVNKIYLFLSFFVKKILKLIKFN